MRVSEEKKKQILELQLSGLGAYRISDIVLIPKTTVSNHMQKNTSSGLVPKKVINKPVEKDCVGCGTKTFNPKFCSSSCAAKYNNKYSIKRTKTLHYCVECNSLLHRKKSTGKCKECSKPKDMTLEEVMERYKDGHRASVYSLVRQRARELVKHIPSICVKCGYSKHTEVCHIKPISSYSLDTKISEINKESNLIKLCPNCHWESENLAN